LSAKKTRSDAVRSAASPALAATVQHAWPHATPTAVRSPPRRPARNEFRIVSAVSCPGVTITSSETPTKAASPVSTRRSVRTGRNSRLAFWQRARLAESEDPDRDDDVLARD